ncbi:mechanosensitive ion channel domain-containing protein [Luteolibacter sp. AS25]|uniref:mechanosensitive ion channel domain-containing protein n=1 Tax=Luteolibacter sp. AS25 TaxID=3135776 RepID=UPI00398B14DF
MAASLAEMKAFLWCLFPLFSFFSAASAQDEETTKATDAVVEVTDVTSDEAIEERLNGIFSQVREFENVTCEVISGVVRLHGTVPDESSRANALALAERTDGVIFTVDRLQVAAEVQAQLTPALKKLRALRTSFVTKLPLIGIAILVVAVSIWLANFLHRRETWFKRWKISSLTRVLIRRVIRMALIGIGFIIALEILDATAVVGAILGAAGLAGLAIGFAFRNIAENYLAGILLSTRNPFELGDAIELNGMIGKVAALSARDTVLITLDGNHLRIPNSVVMNSELLNYSRNPLRRLEFTVGVSVDLELNEARQVGLEAMKSSPGILKDPKPSVTVDSLGDSTVILRFFGWLDQRASDFLKTKSETIRLVKMAYDDAGIEMPEPIYRVVLKNSIQISPDEQSVTAQPSKPDRLRKKPDAGFFDVELSDTSPDRTIDDQIEAEKLETKDENLLEDKAVKMPEE